MSLKHRLATCWRVLTAHDYACITARTRGEEWVTWTAKTHIRSSLAPILRRRMDEQLDEREAEGLNITEVAHRLTRPEPEDEP